jgi:hypothetical protein
MEREKKLKVYDEIKGENVGLISPPMGPTTHWALDPRPNRGRCNTLKFSNFRMLIGKIIKQRFSHNFKVLPKIYLLYRKFRIKNQLIVFIN